MLDLSLLNSPQRAAVEHGGGPLLILAGAGSGKTRVITYRVARLLFLGIPARHIAALSFTNKAAGEMHERVARLVGADGAKELTLSTFHALGLAILKKERRALGLPQGFTIYDGADQLGVVREVLREVRVDDRRFDPKAILSRISRAKNAFVSPDDYEPDPTDEYDEVTQLVYPRYERALRAFAALDFDDLIVETVRLLERDEAARERWEARFAYLLVDEYQDTNRAQLLLVQRLARRSGNVTVVGDDDQSIYAWRGAEVSNILEFERYFPGARIIKLEQNYRSTPTILAAANAVIKNNAARRDKALFSDQNPGELIQVAACPDAEAEAKFVTDELERLRLEERLRFQDCAVLFRSAIQSRSFEEALQGRRIPYEVHGGQTLYERKEVKDLLAYLKVLVFPRDEISLRRIVNYPARGIGAATLEKALTWAAARQVPLWEAFARWDEASESRKDKVREAIASFTSLIDRGRDCLKQNHGGSVAARLVLEETRLYDDLRAAAPSLAAAQRRIDNVESFLRSLSGYEERHPGKLGEYLHYLSLNTKDEDDGAEGDIVTLSTLHGAKGLEWSVVFLVGFEEELLPHARTLFPHGPDLPGEADISEERRLAYVGITRARQRLYLTWARVRHKHGKDRPRCPSRFLQEIPVELTSRRDVAAEAKRPVERQELSHFFQSFLQKT